MGRPYKRESILWVTNEISGIPRLQAKRLLGIWDSSIKSQAVRSANPVAHLPAADVDGKRSPFLRYYRLSRNWKCLPVNDWIPENQRQFWNPIQSALQSLVASVASPSRCKTACLMSKRKPYQVGSLIYAPTASIRLCPNLIQLTDVSLAKLSCSYSVNFRSSLCPRRPCRKTPTQSPLTSESSP